MRLDMWITQERIMKKDFAAMLDISPAHLGAVINGRLPASKKLSRNIEKATKGEVTAKEMLGE
jgi:DNA-binding transcriptional regulator YdaS (Cro superfamily)